MIAYSDKDLEAMLSDLESDLAERKESFKGDSPTKAREAACAFANDLPGHDRPGVLFIGARDDGSPAGLTVHDELLLQLADMKTDGNIVPPPTLTVAKHILRGHEMAVVTVWPADSPPARFRGRIWIRVGPRRAIASSQDERILNEKRRHRDPHSDAQPVVSATLADLGRRRFEEDYLPSAFGPDILAANERSYEQRLAATKMIVSVDDPKPTVTGILTLAARPRDFIPGAYVQFLRVAGREWGDRIHDEAVLDGPVQDMVRRIDEKLAAHNRTAVDFTSGPVEVRSSTYPIPALQQLIRNAVMHRTYEGTNAPARVYWFDDRIEIMNPGGPYGIVTAETFGQPGVVDYRNPSLAEAMRVLGLVQRFGFGIPTARRELRDNNHPELEFRVEPTHVRCTVWARR